MNNRIFIYPMILSSKRRRVQFSESVKLLRIDSPFIRNALGIEDVSVEQKTGFVTHISMGNEEAAHRLMLVHSRLGFDPARIGTENYYLCVDDQHDARRYKQAVLMHFRTLSVPTHAFTDLSSKGPWMQTYNDLKIRWKKRLILDEKAIRKLKNSFANLQSMGAKREQLILNKFTAAESKFISGIPMNIFEHVSLQELILLPESNTELSFRYSLRMAKILEKYYSEDPLESFDMAKEFYKARSKVAHSGTCIQGEEFLCHVSDVSRKLLRCFVKHKEQFTEQGLRTLCLTG